MRMVVTGGAGFIGSCFLWKLNEQGITDIIVVDELDSSEKWKNLVGKQFEDYLDKGAFLQHVINGTLDNTYPYSSQPTLSIFTYEYSLATKEGSTIQVTAICSVGGSISRSLGGSDTSNPGISGFTGIYIIIGLSIITFLVINRRRIKKTNL